MNRLGSGSTAKCASQSLWSPRDWSSSLPRLCSHPRIYAKTPSLFQT